MSDCVTPQQQEQRDENVSPSDADIKCEPIPTSLAYEFSHPELWDENSDKRSKIDKVPSYHHPEDVEPNWVLTNKSDHDFNKISGHDLHQFDVDRVGPGEVCTQFNKKYLQVEKI